MQDTHTHSEINLALESHVNVLSGASERSQAGTIRQYETYPIYVN